MYRKEENIWRIEEHIANSSGNLCLHLVGNLNTYIGKELGKTGYVRNRELEFSAKYVPRTELLTKIDDTIRIVSAVLASMADSAWASEYPILVLKKTSAEYMLMHVATHLTYHLEQVNYHRRLIDK